jgi:hypothetical protein
MRSSRYTSYLLKVQGKAFSRQCEWRKDRDMCPCFPDHFPFSFHQKYVIVLAWILKILGLYNYCYAPDNNTVNKYCIVVFTFFTLIAMSGCSNKNQSSMIFPNEKTCHEIVITLNPKTSEYTISEVLRGAVSFSASVKNQGNRSITFAHPTVCFPADYQTGQSMDFNDRHGKSEILLTLEKPDGKIVVLRDGPHFFDPYNISHFTINPGESKQFHVGWFFQNARGRWEDDLKAETVFKEKGTYLVTLLYRNFFPKGFVYDTSTDKSSLISVWTGEIQSNEVTVEIK